MPFSFIQWFSMFGIVAAVILFMTEIIRWRRLSSVINRKQKVLRTFLVFLVVILFGLMFIGPYLSKYKDPVSELLYWIGCICIVLIMIVLAMADLREVVRGYAEMNHNIFRDLRGDRRKQ